MRTARRATRAPLFLRIFGVMLAALLSAQILNFAMFLAIPPPAPHLYPVTEVAQLLRDGRPPGGEYRVAEQADPPEQSPDPHAGRLRALIAARLGAGADAVRLKMERPPLFIGPVYHHDRPPGEGREILFGRFSAALRQPDGRWRVVQPAPRGLEPWHWRVLFWLLGSVVAVLPFAWLVARRVAQPIGLFAAAAERLGRDPRAEPLALNGPPEVAMAAQAFNEMQARIRRYVDDRMTMAAAVAHDLRTPLMRMALRLEKVPPEQRAALEADIAEMREMINASLAFVRDAARPPRRQRLSLRALAESVGDEMSDLGADVAVTAGDDVVIEADVAGLKALLTNLIGNAVAYAGSARVRLAREDDQAVIEVADDGPGLPEDLLERVFEPFFRAEPSRNRETGGAGLGLASVRAVAHGHGGEVRLSNRAGRGLLARVTLPL